MHISLYDTLCHITLENKCDLNVFLLKKKYARFSSKMYSIFCVQSYILLFALNVRSFFLKAPVCIKNSYTYKYNFIFMVNINEFFIKIWLRN